MKRLRFGPADCILRDFFQDSIWKTAQWKTDSYCVSDGTIYDMEIVRDDGTDKTEQTLLWEEISGFYVNQVFSCEGGLIWRLIRRRNEKIYLRYFVEKDWTKIRLLEDHTESAGHAAFEYLGNMVSYGMIMKKVLTLHGVLMEYQGKGIIISAASGTGKTTHARLWRDAKNALIINGDRASCYKKEGKWTGFGIPWCGTSGEHMNRQTEIGAVVVLERGGHNHAEVIQGFEKFQCVFPHIQYPVWEKDMLNRVMDLTEDFLKELCVIRLTCRPDAESVEVLYETMKKEKIFSENSDII